MWTRIATCKAELHFDDSDSAAADRAGLRLKFRYFLVVHCAIIEKLIFAKTVLSIMKKITKAAVAWDGLQANLCRAISEWSPQDFQREKQYKDSLASYLRECAPDARIQCEYRHLGTTTDIYVEFDGLIGTDRVFIELKRNLIRKSELNRLVGQIDDLKPEENNLIIVLCGDTAAGMLDRLKAKCNGWRPSLVYKPNTAIVTK